MYPYNTKNMRKTNNIKIANASFDTSEDTSDIREMLMDAIREADYHFRHYTTLSDAIENTDDAELIKSVAYDQYKHRRLLEEVYYSLTGELAPQIDITLDTIEENLMTEFTNSLFRELDNVEYHRQLMASFENPSVRDIFFEIITDDQAHADIFNYLIGKYR